MNAFNFLKKEKDYEKDIPQRNSSSSIDKNVNKVSFANKEEKLRKDSLSTNSKDKKKSKHIINKKNVDELNLEYLKKIHALDDVSKKRNKNKDKDYEEQNYLYNYEEYRDMLANINHHDQNKFKIYRINKGENDYYTIKPKLQQSNYLKIAKRYTEFINNDDTIKTIRKEFYYPKSQRAKEKEQEEKQIIRDVELYGNEVLKKREDCKKEEELSNKRIIELNRISKKHIIKDELNKTSFSLGNNEVFKKNLKHNQSLIIEGTKNLNGFYEINQDSVDVLNRIGRTTQYPKIKIEKKLEIEDLNKYNNLIFYPSVYEEYKIANIPNSNNFLVEREEFINKLIEQDYYAYDIASEKIEFIEDDVKHKILMLKYWEKELPDNQIISNSGKFEYPSYYYNKYKNSEEEKKTLIKNYLIHVNGVLRKMKEQIKNVPSKRRNYGKAYIKIKCLNNHSLQYTTLDNTILVLHSLNYFKKQFMFHIFKNDKNQMVFEEKISKPKKKAQFISGKTKEIGKNVLEANDLQRTESKNIKKDDQSEDKDKNEIKNLGEIDVTYKNQNQSVHELKDITDLIKNTKSKKMLELEKKLILIETKNNIQKDKNQLVRKNEELSNDDDIDDIDEEKQENQYTNINFGSPIFKTLNVQIAKEAVQSFDQKEFTSLIQAREEFESFTRREQFELLLTLYKIKIEIGKYNEKAAEVLNQLNDIRSDYYTEKEANESIKKQCQYYYGEINTRLIKAITEQSVNSLFPLLSFFENKINLIEKKEEELLKAYNIEKKIKNTLLSKIKDQQNELKTFLIDLENYYETFNGLIKDYYLDILKIGLDVRKDGLMWVILRLLEINSSISKESFPKFLTKREVNYLLSISKKMIMYKQYNNIATHLKETILKKKLENDKKSNKNEDFLNRYETKSFEKKQKQIEKIGNMMGNYNDVIRGNTIKKEKEDRVKTIAPTSKTMSMYNINNPKYENRSILQNQALFDKERLNILKNKDSEIKLPYQSSSPKFMENNIKKIKKVLSKRDQKYKKNISNRTLFLFEDKEQTKNLDIKNDSSNEEDKSNSEDEKNKIVYNNCNDIINDTNVNNNLIDFKENIIIQENGAINPSLNKIINKNDLKSQENFFDPISEVEKGMEESPKIKHHNPQAKLSDDNFKLMNETNDYDFESKNDKLKTILTKDLESIAEEDKKSVSKYSDSLLSTKKINNNKNNVVKNNKENGMSIDIKNILKENNNTNNIDIINDLDNTKISNSINNTASKTVRNTFIPPLIKDENELTKRMKKNSEVFNKRLYFLSSNYDVVMNQQPNYFDMYKEKRQTLIRGLSKSQREDFNSTNEIIKGNFFLNVSKLPNDQAISIITPNNQVNKNNIVVHKDKNNRFSIRRRSSVMIRNENKNANHKGLNSLRELNKAEEEREEEFKKEVEYYMKEIKEFDPSTVKEKKKNNKSNNKNVSKSLVSIRNNNILESTKSNYSIISYNENNDSDSSKEKENYIVENIYYKHKELFTNKETTNSQLHKINEMKIKKLINKTKNTMDKNQAQMIYYRNKIEQEYSNILNTKSIEIERFKKEFKNEKYLNQNTKIEYDLMFCSLFGHNKSII